MQQPLSIFIVGTTAVGKTKLSIQLCKALGGQIINCDSKQLYKYANIMTAKATTQQKQNIPHHMMSMLELHQNCYNRNKYYKEAIQCMEDIRARGKVPVVVGGTNYYLETLLYDVEMGNLDSLESNDEEKQENANKQKQVSKQKQALKQELVPKQVSFQQANPQQSQPKLTKQLLYSMPNPQKYTLLQKIDPIMSQKLHQNDQTRITRFLQRYIETGIKPSQNYKPYVHKLRNSNSILFWIRNSNKKQLYDFMSKRIEKMVYQDGGLLEILTVFKYADMRGLVEGLQMGALQSIGYKEFSEVYEKVKGIIGDQQFDKELKDYPQIQQRIKQKIQQILKILQKCQAQSIRNSKKITLLQQCIQKLQKNTMDYSKRQITWIKNRLFACQDNRSHFFTLELSKQYEGNNNGDKDHKHKNQGRKQNKSLAERFQVFVKNRAIQILGLIQDKGFGVVKESQKQFGQNKHQSIHEWKKYKCDDCGVEANGSKQWTQHLNSKRHKGSLSKKQRKKALKGQGPIDRNSQSQNDSNIDQSNKDENSQNDGQDNLQKKKNTSLKNDE